MNVEEVVFINSPTAAG